jgi:protein-disulfide isomerase
VIRPLIANTAVRRKRPTRLGGRMALALIAGVAVLSATSCAGAKPPATPPNSRTNAVAAEVGTLLAGIPQSGDALGSPTAPVTLEYFGDLECPICRKFTLGALNPIIQRWVREGKLRIEYHNLQTATREPETFNSQQDAALSAGQQAKLWNFIETFYHEQGQEDSGYVTEQYLRNIAQQVPGLNMARWASERGKPEFQAQIQVDAQTSDAAGLTGTPSFLIGHTGGATTVLPESEYGSLEQPSGFDQAIEKQLKA